MALPIPLGNGDFSPVWRRRSLPIPVKHVKEIWSRDFSPVLGD